MEIQKLNQATVEELAEIEGIGQKHAKEIIEYREENGDFENWEEVKNIPDFNEELVEVLKSQGEEDEEESDQSAE